MPNNHPCPTTPCWFEESGKDQVLFQFSQQRGVDELFLPLSSLLALIARGQFTFGTMTTQAPDLTTTFTPDKSCFQYYKYRYTGDEITCKEGGTGAPSACTYMQLGPSGSDAGCFPSSLELGSTFYYSPGVCPSGFEVACSSTFGGETRATCCPR